LEGRKHERGRISGKEARQARRERRVEERERSSEGKESRSRRKAALAEEQSPAGGGGKGRAGPVWSGPSGRSWQEGVSCKSSGPLRTGTQPIPPWPVASTQLPDGSQARLLVCLLPSPWLHAVPPCVAVDLLGSLGGVASAQESV
jgi:hypothetical protein